jgi:hypothetical protein
MMAKSHDFGSEGARQLFGVVRGPIIYILVIATEALIRIALTVVVGVTPIR